MEILEIPLKYGKRMDAWYGVPLKNMSNEELIHLINVIAEQYEQKISELKNADEVVKAYGVARYEDI